MVLSYFLGPPWPFIYRAPRSKGISTIIIESSKVICLSVNILLTTEPIKFSNFREVSGIGLGDFFCPLSPIQNSEP